MILPRAEVAIKIPEPAFSNSSKAATFILVEMLPVKRKTGVSVMDWNWWTRHFASSVKEVKIMHFLDGKTLASNNLVFSSWSFVVNTSNLIFGRKRLRLDTNGFLSSAYSTVFSIPPPIGVAVSAILLANFKASGRLCTSFIGGLKDVPQRRSQCISS